MPESFRTRLTRWIYNFFPAYRGTGAWVTYIDRTYQEVKIRLPLSWRTRNYVGTIYGGSMYSAVDPFYMIMLIKLLGPEYVVWDKAGAIRFKIPGRKALYAAFQISNEELETIRRLLRETSKVDRTYRIELKDINGVVHAEIEKTIHIKRRDWKSAT